MKVVIDTNTFIDAFFDDNEDCKLVLREEHKGEFELLMSHETSEELLRILEIYVKKAELNGQQTTAIFKMICRSMLRASMVKPKKKFTKCEDPDDNMFFECAIDGNADYIISRDAHLHALKEDNIKNKLMKPIKILYPDEFIMEIKTIKLVTRFNN